MNPLRNWFKTATSTLAVVLAICESGCNRPGTSPAPQIAPDQSSSDAAAPPAPTPAKGALEKVKPFLVTRATATWYEVPPDSRPARRAPGEWTAAHDKLPLGSYARVINESNGRTVTVRITDRGVGRRKIDLCKPAAEELKLVGPGKARVRIEALPGPPVK